MTASGRAAAHMVTLTRETKGWTQETLATAAGVSQGFLSKVENGLLPLEGEYLERVAEALEVPADLLRSTEPVRGLEVTCLHNRRRRSRMTVGTVKHIEGLTHLTRLSVEGLIRGVEIAPPLHLHRLDVDAYGSPEEIARTLRAAWRLPSGPVANVIRILEAAGIVVVRRDLRTDAQDAVSTWQPNGNPLILINAGLPADRERFTLIHELGHLTMHELPSEEQEAEANRFAGEFLAPAEEIRPQLTGLTMRDFGKLADLKMVWGMSMAALIQRARDLECISANQFKSFRIRLNQYGWSRTEPGDVPAEAPSLLDSVIDVHQRQHGYSERELAAAALMLPAPFTRHYLAHRRSTPQLRPVR